MLRAIFENIARYWVPLSLFSFSVITVLSLLPLAELPEMPGSDKTHHFIAYGLLMFPVALRQPKHWLLIGFAFIVWSGAIELVQPFVNRYGEWLDLLANSGGVLLGAVIGKLTAMRTLKRH